MSRTFTTDLPIETDEGIDIECDVEYEYEPPSSGGREDPGCPGGCIITKVVVCGHELKDRTGPDGKELVCFTERELSSLEYLANEHLKKSRF